MGYRCYIVARSACSTAESLVPFWRELEEDADQPKHHQNNRYQLARGYRRRNASIHLVFPGRVTSI